MSARLEPARSEAARIGVYTLIVNVDGELDVQDPILIDFPKAWFPHPWPRKKPLQSERPNEPHHISATIDSVAAHVTWDHFAVNGKRERFRHLLAVRPTVPLEGDSTLVLRWSNTTAPYISGSDAVRVWAREGGNGWVTTSAPYTIDPGPPRWLRVYAPSKSVVGAPVALDIIVLDRFYNHASGFSSQAVVEVDNEIFATPIVAGSGNLSWTPERPGVYWPQARVRNPGGEIEIGDGNPIQVLVEDASPRLFWGDLHSHSRISMDAVGSGDFRYARDVARLDFYAPTEHADDDPFPSRVRRDGITPGEWLELRKRVQGYYQAHEFVTLLGYECSLQGGHYNVYFSDLEGVPSPAHDVRRLNQLLLRLHRGKAFAIPHHTGKRPVLTSTDVIDGPGLQPLGEMMRPAARNTLVGWDAFEFSDGKVPAIEIYSGHGSSEHYDPQGPLSYENVWYTGSMSEPGPYYAQDAWQAGHRLGVVAASDNHIARPGIPNLGLTAVYAQELTREAVFENLRDRRSYGTTGERIILDLKAGVASMGESLSLTTAERPVDVTLFLAAPRNLASVELVAYRPEQGWTIIKRWRNLGRMHEATTLLNDVEPGMLVYLRADLVTETDGRLARAWSSPIWFQG